jgi:hypothetical protein
LPTFYVCSPKNERETVHANTTTTEALTHS